MELLESNAEQLRWSRDLNSWSRDALVVINAAAGSCPESRPESGPGRVEEWGVVAYVVDASEADGFLLEDVTGGGASPEVFSRLEPSLPHLARELTLHSGACFELDGSVHPGFCLGRVMVLDGGQVLCE